MQPLSLISLAAMTCTALALLAAPAGAQAPAPQQSPQAQAEPPLAPPRPYKVVAVTVPPAVTDASLEAFRKQLADIAQRKDRAALARVIVSKGFFWERENGDGANRDKPGIENFATATTLDAKDGSGWALLADFAAEPTASQVGDRKDFVCAPSAPVFKDEEFEAVFKATETDPGEWGYPLRDGAEVREGALPNDKVTEKLGMHLVRVMPDDTPLSAAASLLRIVTPSGKVGYVSADLLSPLGFDQICYVKEGNNWKIAGYIGEGGLQQ